MRILAPGSCTPPLLHTTGHFLRNTPLCDRVFLGACNLVQKLGADQVYIQYKIRWASGQNSVLDLQPLLIYSKI